MDFKIQLDRLGVNPDPLKDQFFLIDNETIDNMVKLAKIKPTDTVLEIGAGTGNLTKKLASTGAKIIAYEIDEQFKAALSSLTGNVNVRFEDAHKYASGGGKYLKKKEFNKIVASIPYSIGEWLLHNLTYVDYDKVILLVSKKFAKTIKTNHIFASFFKVEEKFEVPKNKFFPVPKIDSVVIDLISLQNPVKTKNLGLFLRQFIYQNEGWKVKNSLREGLIEYARLVYKKQLTKKQAKELIKERKISNSILENPPDKQEAYLKVGKLFNNSLFKGKISINVN